MSPFTLRCPSCDHGNPVGSNFCNNCGAPVHFETCSHCEAINDRGAPHCHKCGSPLSLSLELLSIPATAVAFATGTESSRGWTVADQGAPAREPRAHANDAIIDEGGGSISSGVEHMARADETLAPPHKPAEQDFDVHAGHADSQTTRRRSPGLALAVVMLVALAVPAYVAYEDPAQFHQAFDAITPTLDGSSNAHSTLSPQTIPANAPVAEPLEATPLIQDSAGGSQEPTVDATGAAESQADNIASEPPPPQTVGDSSPSTSGASTAPPPQAAKTVRKSAAKSGASKSKQGSSSRKPASRKPSDARAGAKATSPAPAPASAPSAATTPYSRDSRD